MSAFSTVVGRLGDLSESELRQLYLIVGVRLGYPDGQNGQSTRSGGKASGKSTKTSKAGKSKGSGDKVTKSSSSKGNPERKSQWETHPLYREYKRLKKVVETQAKEAKLPFASVDTPERAAYNIALEAWLGAKSSFRGRQTTTEEGAEASSAKGKERAVETARGTHSGDPTPTDKVGRATWADEAQEAAEGESSSEDEDLPDAPDVEEPGSSTGIGAQPIIDRRKPPVHEKPTPPKKSSGGAKKAKN